MNDARRVFSVLFVKGMVRFLGGAGLGWILALQVSTKGNFSNFMCYTIRLALRIHERELCKNLVLS